MASVLDLVKRAARRSTQAVPSTLFTSPTEAEELALEALLMTAEDLLTANAWTELKKTYEFTTTSDDTYSLPSDFDRFLLDGAWDVTNQWRLNGPLSNAEFNEYEFFLQPVTSPSSFRLFGQLKTLGAKPLEFYNPPVGLDFSFDYISTHLFADSAGSATKEEPTADSDIFLLDDRLILLGWPFFYKTLLREPAEAEAALYGRMVDRRAARVSGPSRSFRMRGSSGGRGPYVTDGGWSV